MAIRPGRRRSDAAGGGCGNPTSMRRPAPSSSTEPMRWLQKDDGDSVFMIVFCAVALVLWLVNGGVGWLSGPLLADNTWVWVARIAALATVFGTILVLIQLRVILQEQERLTAALLKG